MLTLQDIFNAAWEQAKLKKKAYDPEIGRCLYRKYNEDGTCDKCFIGAIITDEQYKSHDLENQPGANLVQYTLNLMPNIKHVERTAINELQSIHDDYNIDEWNDELVAYAAKYELVVPV